MQVEFTGRHMEVPKKLRASAQQRLDDLEKILGSSCSAHVIFTEEKFRKIAEVTVSCKLRGDLTAKCEDKEMEKALHDVLIKIETQAVKFVKKAATKRRHPEKSAVGSVRLQSEDDGEKVVSTHKRVAATVRSQLAQAV